MGHNGEVAVELYEEARTCANLKKAIGGTLYPSSCSLVEVFLFNGAVTDDTIYKEVETAAVDNGETEVRCKTDTVNLTSTHIYTNTVVGRKSVTGDTCGGEEKALVIIGIERAEGCDAVHISDCSTNCHTVVDTETDFRHKLEGSTAGLGVCGILSIVKRTGGECHGTAKVKLGVCIDAHKHQESRCCSKNEFFHK